MKFTRIAVVIACAAMATAEAQPPKQPPKASQPQQRDLTIEKLGTEATPPKTVAIPRSYAVIVGISRYKNLAAQNQLKFPERDAQAIKTILINPEGGSFKEENVHVLIGSQATLANIRKEIGTWLPSQSKDGDRVLIYFAGHGFIDKSSGKGYLAPYDIDPQQIAATGYPMEELGSVIGGKIQATSKILLTDACHSGAITPEDTETLNHTLTDLNKSLFSLTASRDRESSFETSELEGGHGVFTYYVKEGLAGAADMTPRDGIVTADELAEYVHTQVRDYVQKNGNGQQQNPTSDKGSYNPEMLLSYVPANAEPGTPPTPKVGGLVFESNMDGVEVFLDGNSIGVLNKGQAVPMPGLAPGQHTVQGVKNGYEPDGPRQVVVYPGGNDTVSINIRFPRRHKKEAMDLVDQGNKVYLTDQNYKKAAEILEKAFQIDPTYSQAAYYLARTYNALFDEQKAEVYFKKALEIDPDYTEARANYAGMLLDSGSVDEALIQINAVLVRDPNDVDALRHQAQALRFKGLYPRSIEAARKAIQLKPTLAEPHLWLGDSLRLSGKVAESEPEYIEYLKLSNLNSHLAGHLNYYLLGFTIGMGKKKRAAEEDIWKQQRSLAYYGLCDAERLQKRFLTAIPYCQQALSYDGQDALAHYTLGLCYFHQAAVTDNEGPLYPALKHFQQFLAIN
ncbi:MAG TPA: tetratricopeptide repeat protein, partial [Bryobacteraceae bacterium]